MNNLETFDDLTGRYDKLKPQYYIGYDTYKVGDVSYKIMEGFDVHLMWGPSKEMKEGDKLLKNIDICLELIDEYERGISKI
jgi:hypothetical protein